MHQEDGSSALKNYVFLGYRVSGVGDYRRVWPQFRGRIFRYLGKWRRCAHCMSCEKIYVQLSSFCMRAWKSAVLNGSGRFPAISPLNAVMRRNREKRFSGGRWPCNVTTSHVSAGTKTC